MIDVKNVPDGCRDAEGLPRLDVNAPPVFCEGIEGGRGTNADRTADRESPKKFC
jgi:hypothetical protein